MDQNLVARLVERVEQHTGLPARMGSNGYVCRCPAHDDDTPSLSIRGGAQGQVLVHCFAGCSYEAVLAAVGLTPADARAEDPQSAGVPSSQGIHNVGQAVPDNSGMSQAQPDLLSAPSPPRSSCLAPCFW